MSNKPAMDFSSANSLRLPVELVEQVSAYIAAEMGLALLPERWPELERALHAVAPLLNCADATACAWHLLSTPPTRREIELLARHLTVGETFFFREAQVFALLEYQILPALLAARRQYDKRLRVWSAGCASGEEIYSLAMLLDWLLPDYDEWNVTLLATDINPEALEKATAGIYREWSFRALPLKLRQRYFHRLDDGSYELDARIRQRVSFNYLNLSEDNYPSLLSNTNALDVIFCRNVLMYFTPARAQQVVQRFNQCLLEDGWLAVSQTEVSHFQYEPFETVNFEDAILYRKPGQFANLRTPVEPEVWPAPDWLAPEPFAVPLLLQEPVPDLAMAAPPVETPIAQPAFVDAAQCAERARACANEGQFEDAAGWCERALAADNLKADYHYLSAIIAQERGRNDAARQALRRALFIEHDFPVAHYALGNLVRQLGKAEDAARHFANALRVLRGHPADELLREGEGLTAGGLRALISASGIPVSEARGSND